MTALPSSSTLMRCASTSALRLNASSIFVLIVEDAPLDLTFTRFQTPRTPVRRRTVSSAAVRWYPQSTSPSRVIQPLSTRTLMQFGGMELFHSTA